MEPIEEHAPVRECPVPLPDAPGICGNDPAPGRVLCDAHAIDEHRRRVEWGSNLAVWPRD